MRNSYTAINYNEEIRPYSQYSKLLSDYLVNHYFKSTKGKLLDVCCGRGEYLERFKDIGFNVYGVDKETVALDKGYNAPAIDLEFENLPWDGSYFDYILIKSAIEHIRNIYHLMDEVYRVLRPGGKLVIITCDWKTVYKIFHDDIDHKTPFTAFSLENMMLRYGFQDVKVRYFYHQPFTWDSKLGSLLAGLIGFCIPLNYSPTVKLNRLVKLIKFSREKQLLAYGVK